MLTAAVFVYTLFSMLYFWKKTEHADDRERRKFYLLLFLVSCINAVAVRYRQSIIPKSPFQVSVLKFCASLPSVILAAEGFRKKKDRFDLLLLAAIILCLVADVTINRSFTAGGAVFFAGHICFNAAFLGRRKPGKKQLLMVCCAFLFCLFALFWQRDHLGSLLNYLLSAVYLTILASTLIFSFPLDKEIFAAAAVFAVSDLLMIGNILFSGGTGMRTLALIIYYASLLLYGAAIWEKNLPGQNNN